MTYPQDNTGRLSGQTGWRATPLFARTGIALAATAPIALVTLAALPGERPTDLVPCILSVVAASLLIIGAELAAFEHKPSSGPAVPPAARRESWTDPAMVSVERWLGRWPGVAGVTGVAWWAARVGAAGLLVHLSFHAAGIPFPLPLSVAAVACLVATTLVPAGRHLVHVALGAVASLGVIATLSGLVAVAQGHLTHPLLPGGPMWPTAGTAGAEMVSAATTVVLLCLPSVALLAVAPASSAAGRTRWLTMAATGTAICCWVFGVPALLRAAGLGWTRVALSGSEGALSTSLRLVLAPIAGSHAGTAAQCTLCVVGVAAAVGALSGATTLAENAFRAAKATGSASNRAGPLSGPFTRRLQPNGLPSKGLGTAASLSVVGGAVAAAIGPTSWFLAALAASAASALALTTIAPPALKCYQLVPRVGRIGVAAVWAVAVTLAVGAAGPAALALCGAGALVGAFAMAWGTAGGPIGHWQSRRPKVPWEIAAATLVTVSAVTTLELLPTGIGSGNATTWRGLAVVVMAAGIVVMGVIPATSRLWTERLNRAATALAERTLPTLAATVEALADGQVQRVPLAEMASLKAIARPLEAGDSPPEHLRVLAGSLAEAAKQALRLAASIDMAASVETRRLEELVDARTSAIASVNRNLVDSHWQRRQLFDRTVRAAESERARLASDLHDGPIQRLATLGLVLDRCRLRLDRDDTAAATELVKRARSDLAEEISRLRQMMSELRPPVLDEGGLSSALQDQLSSWSQATGIEGHFESAHHGMLSADSETVIYRIVQESLANVAKHAKAGIATVAIGPSGSGVLAIIRDDGKGFNVGPEHDLLRQGHFGLVVMRERVELASGRFEVRSRPLGGTEVRVWLPTASTASLARPGSPGNGSRPVSSAAGTPADVPALSAGGAREYVP